VSADAITAPPEMGQRWTQMSAPPVDRPLSLKAELRQAVRGQPDDGPIPHTVWELMLESLELTALAASSAQRNIDCGSAALIASCASAAAGRAILALPAGTHAFGPPRPRRAPAQDPLRRVRQTSVRLVGLLLAGGPSEPDLLRAVVAEHRAALQAWRQQLRETERLLRTTEGRRAGVARQ
jgi:hypothetical protein